MYYDSHFHLNGNFELTEAIKDLKNIQQRYHLSNVNVIRLNSDPFPIDKLIELLRNEKEIKLVEHVNPLIKTDYGDLRELIEKGQIVALKLHPRIDKYSLEEKEVLNFLNTFRHLKLPIYICSFWDGTWNRYGLEVSQYANVADKFPDLNFIWSHFGGHRILDFMMMLRRRKNVFADISLSLHYFYGDFFQDQLAYCISSLKGRRIFFGSDYPNSEYSQVVEFANNIKGRLKQMEMTKSEIDKVFYGNAIDFFGDGTSAYINGRSE